MKIICKVAIPTGIENGLFQLGKLLVQSTVATLGTTAIAAQAMINTLDVIQSTPGVAVGLGLLTVAGQCMGAGRPDEARRYTRKHCVISWCVVLGTSLFFLVLTPSICRLSGLSAPAAELTFRMLLLITVMKLLFWVPAFTLPNTPAPRRRELHRAGVRRVHVGVPVGPERPAVPGAGLWPDRRVDRLVHRLGVPPDYLCRPLPHRHVGKKGSAGGERCLKITYKGQEWPLWKTPQGHFGVYAYFCRLARNWSATRGAVGMAHLPLDGLGPEHPPGRIRCP